MVKLDLAKIFSGAVPLEELPLKSSVLVRYRPNWIKHGEPLLPPVHCRGFEVVLAGLSEDLGFQAYFVSATQPGGEPYELWGLPNAVAALPGTEGAQEAVKAAIGDPETCDVRAIGHVAMGELRGRAQLIKPEWGADWIGGFTQLTTLSIETGRPIVTTEILGRWKMPGAMAA